MALIVNLALNANNAEQMRYRAVYSSTPEPIKPVPDCSEDLYMGDKPCMTFLYTPSTDPEIQVSMRPTCWQTALLSGMLLLFNILGAAHLQ
jgi:hypothetical protein